MQYKLHQNHVSAQTMQYYSRLSPFYYRSKTMAVTCSFICLFVFFSLKKYLYTIILNTFLLLYNNVYHHFITNNSMFNNIL